MLIFLNIQTTGIEVEDKICSISILYEEEEEHHSMYNLVNEGKKISSKASSFHHITNEMLQNKSSLVESEIYHFLMKNNSSATSIVGHNIISMMEKISQYGYKFKGILIDTKRVSKHLIQECESYQLQFLRYELKLYKNEKKYADEYEINTLIACNTQSDALITKVLFFYLLEERTIEELAKLSFENVLLEKFDFGKYSGRYIEEIILNDNNYIEWILHNIHDIDEDLQFSIEYYKNNL